MKLLILKNVMLVIFLLIAANASAQQKNNRALPSIFYLLLTDTDSEGPCIADVSFAYISNNGVIVNCEEETYYNGDIFEWTVYNVKYVTNTTINGNGTQGSPWTLEQALSQADGGDLVYLKKGVYPAREYTQTKSGAPGSLIMFIGTDETWQPITTPTNRSTYTNGDTFSGNDMPFIDTGLADGERASGTGINTRGSYVHFENITIRGYATNFRATGSNSRFINVNTGLAGDFRESNTLTQNWTDYYLGRNFDLYGSNNTLLNSFHRDADAQGVNIGDGGGHTVLYLEYQGSGDAYRDDIDYPVLIESDNNEVGHITIKIALNADHPQHGLVFKPTGTTAVNNHVHNIFLVNTKLELQFPGVNNNHIEYVTLINEGTVFSDGFGHTTILITNGAHTNTISNVIAYRPTWLVSFSENNDSNGIRTSGSDNTLINILAIKPFWGVFSYSGNSGNTLESMPKNFTMYNATIIGSPWLNYYAGSPTGTATGGIYNSIFKNVGTSAFDASSKPSGVGLNNSFEFDYINLDGGSSQASYAPFADSNFTSLGVTFIDEKTTTTDTYDYTPTIEIPGFDFSVFNSIIGRDLNGLIRTAPYTMGAVERSGIPASN